MGQGIEPPSYPCMFCKKDVPLFNAVINEGQYYHDHCFKMVLSRDLAHYDKKTQLGTLTLAESNLVKDINFQLEIAKNLNTKPSGNNKPHDTQINKQKLIYREETRKENSRSVIKRSSKRLEASRAERWAWETFSTVEVKALDCSYDTLLLSENHDK